MTTQEIIFGIRKPLETLSSELLEALNKAELNNDQIAEQRLKVFYLDIMRATTKLGIIE